MIPLYPRLCVLLCWGLSAFAFTFAFDDHPREEVYNPSSQRIENLWEKEIDTKWIILGYLDQPSQMLLQWPSPFVGTIEMRPQEEGRQASILQFKCICFWLLCLSRVQVYFMLPARPPAKMAQRWQATVNHCSGKGNSLKSIYQGSPDNNNWENPEYLIAEPAAMKKLARRTVPRML